MTHADSFDRSPGRRGRAARAGRAPRDPRRRRVQVGEAVRALPQGAGHRPRRRHGKRRQPRHRPPDRGRALVPRRRRRPHGCAGARRARRRRAADHRRLVAVQGRCTRSCLRADVGRHDRPRPPDRRRRQPRRPGRHSRMEDDAAADRGRGGARARAVLRRVPLHACRHGGPDGRHQLRGHSHRARRDQPPADRGGRHHDAEGDRRPPRPWHRRRGRDGDLHRDA